MKILVLILTGLLVAGSVAAQPIHGHPLKAAYADPTEWPFVSAQCHWKVNGMLGHTHVEALAPIYSEFGGTRLTIPIQFQLFHTSGKIIQVWSQLGVIQWTSINPINAQYPNIQGDPGGVVIVTGLLHIEPHRSATNVAAGPTWWNPHGWTSVQLSARTLFPNGSRTDTSISLPFFSVKDLTKPIVVPGENASLMLRSQCSPPDPWGSMISEFKGYVPIGILPADQSFNPVWGTYSYGATPPMQSGTKDRRLNPDLHNGFDGIQITTPVMFDSTFSGIGTHRFSFIWGKTIGATPPAGTTTGQEAAALLVVRVTVGEDIPPAAVATTAATATAPAPACMAMTMLDHYLSSAQALLRDGHHDKLSEAIAEARNLIAELVQIKDRDATLAQHTEHCPYCRDHTEHLADVEADLNDKN